MSINDNDIINETRSLLTNLGESNNDEYTDADESESKGARRVNGISWYFAVFLIVNAALGAGLLNFAKAYDSAGGILISSFIQLVK
jgi:hypothetical protein